MRKLAVCLTALALFVLAVPGSALAQVDARMLRYPDVSETHIAFVYAGDIWVVSKDGGVAQRLSSPPGEETYPRFSPDGSRIAFSGNYDGNTDVYVVPALGGALERITYHPGGDRLVDWTPDGDRLIFASGRHAGIQRFNQLFTVAATGGLSQRLPVAYGEYAAMSDDGRWLAFTPKDRGTRNWKRYRGGMAPDIWLFDLESYDATNISESDANEMRPMFHGRTLYFVSDRGDAQRMNIWAYGLDDQSMRQVTHFEEFDITLPAIGPDDIVFQAGGRMYLLSLADEQVREIQVDVVTDLATVRPRTADVAGLIAGANISPSGARAVVEARGELFTVPAENGIVRNLTRSSGVAERYPAWSPDGRNIAYWSDRSDEYELMLRPASGGDETQLTDLGPGYRYGPIWSPDSKKIAFIDSQQIIRVLDVGSRALTEVDSTLWLLHPQLAGFEVSWSADSRWLTYSRGLESSQSAIFLFDTRTGERHQVTSGYYSDSGPRFDPDGDYLYYLSNRTLRPIYSDLDATWVYPNTTNIVAVPLRADVKSPLAPRNDDEEVAPEEAEAGDDDTDIDATAGDGVPADEAGTEDSAADEEPEADEGLRIDIDGFERRVVVLPPQAGNYGTLRAVSGKVVFTRFARSGATGPPSIVAWDLASREEQPLVPGAGNFEISADGRKMLVGRGGGLYIVDVRPGQRLEERLSTDLEMTVEPRAEWRQIFNDVWRAYRDFFYDPDLHGLDWEAMRELYGTLIESAVTRWDVNAILGELIGEVNASHTYVGGGDTETPRRARVGLLGIDWEMGDGAYRIGRIVEGAEWDAEARSPFSEPGVEVAAGDYLLAVNGEPIDPRRSPHAAFEGLAGTAVMLSVNDSPDLDGARDVLVETLTSEARLRHLEWIEGNRRRVAEASGGRVGYIFVPNTAVPGQTELVRQFNSQMRLDGLIIDERFNAGGQLPDRFIELMTRQLVNRIKFRSGAVATQPNVTHYGSKVMLINGWAGSGGDAFPYFFRTMGAGPIIGERTWGGLIGPAVGHQTIDGGGFTAPPGRIYGPDGSWFPEGIGVEPDIYVVDHPSELARGTDPQLEAAIQEVLRLVEENPVTLPGPPAYERRTAPGSRQR